MLLTHQAAQGSFRRDATEVLKKMSLLHRKSLEPDPCIDGEVSCECSWPHQAAQGSFRCDATEALKKMSLLHRKSQEPDPCIDGGGHVQASS